MESLFSLLERIKECFGVQICVHDVSGVTYTRASLSLPYTWKQHDCDFCWAAKHCVGEKRCMLQKQLVMWKLRRSGMKPFFGICNMGVCEYILPVLNGGQLVAVVFASGYAAEDGEAARGKLERALEGAPPQRREETLAHYERFASSCATTRRALQFWAELVSERIRTGAFAATQANQDGSFAVESVRRSENGTVRAMLGYLEASMPGAISLSDLSRVFFMSEGHLCRLFRREMGMSIMTYVKRMRMQMAARLLCDTDDPISAISEQVGIHDPNYFCRTFKSMMKITPGEYRAARAKGLL